MHTRRVNSLIFVANRVWSASEDMKIILWNPEVGTLRCASSSSLLTAMQTFEVARTIDAHKGKILSMIVLEKTRQVLSSSWDCQVKVPLTDRLRRIPRVIIDMIAMGRRHGRSSEGPPVSAHRRHQRGDHCTEGRPDRDLVRLLG